MNSEQVPLKFQTDTGEITPASVKQGKNHIQSLNKFTFDVGSKSVIVSLYKIRGTETKYLINHMTTDQRTRDHYYLLGTIPELHAEISTLLQKINSKLFWKIIYTELFRQTSVQLPDLPVITSFELNHMKPLQNIFSDRVYTYLFEVYRDNTPKPIFPNSEYIYTHPTISISGKNHDTFAQTLAVRKLMYSSIDTVFWFNTVLSRNETSITKSTTDKISTTLSKYNEVHVKRKGHSYSKKLVQKYVKTVLSLSQNVCFVFNRYLFNALSKDVIDRIRKSNAHLITSTNIGHPRIGGYDVFIEEVTDMKSEENISKVYTTDTVTVEEDSERRASSPVLQFGSFEVFPVTLTNEVTYDVLPTFYGKL